MDVFDALSELAATRLRASALAPFVQSLWDRLSERQYSPGTARQYMNCVAHFAHWSRRRRFALRTLDRHVVSFLDEHLLRCTCAAPVQRSRNQICAALQHLKAVVCASVVQQDDRPGNPVDEQLLRFDDHLLHAKGLAGSTRLRRKIQNLLHLDFVAQHANVVFISGVGLGKSHLMTALGYAACQRGNAVLFTGAIDIINTLATAHAAGGLKRALAAYVKPEVLCIDELGYQRNRQVRRRLPVPDHQPPLRARRHAVDDEPDLQAMGQHLQR